MRKSKQTREQDDLYFFSPIHGFGVDIFVKLTALRDHDFVKMKPFKFLA